VAVSLSAVPTVSVDAAGSSSSSVSTADYADGPDVRCHASAGAAPTTPVKQTMNIRRGKRMFARVREGRWEK
jgi:hypothetical protein